MEDLVQVLTKFHREIVLPDVQRLVGGLRQEMNARFDAVDRRFEGVDRRFDEVTGHLDAIYQRFDKLETGLQEQVRTLEARLDG